MKHINIGLIGLGTVGTGVTKILLGEKPVLDEKLECVPVLKAIADRSIDAKAAKLGLLGQSILLSSNPDDVINNSEIDVIVEVIGGIDPARQIINRALENGKNVVTANKELLAIHGTELFEKACKFGRCISFEASVCGGIPIIATLKDSLIANRIKSLYGIVNGTTNYILTRMTMNNTSYSDALAEAQNKGYAEQDPTKDVNGMDSAYKLAILAKLAYGLKFDFDKIYCEGISELELEDICYAKRLGYTLKLLAISKNTCDGFELRVHPALLPDKHPLAMVSDVNNGVYIMGDAVGEMMLCGPGAGSMPTASSIVADIVDVSLGKAKTTFDNFKYYREQQSNKKIMDISEIQTRYYLHFLVADTPGVLAKISGIMGANNIGIASVIQQEGKKQGGVPLVMLTHIAKEGDLRKAITEIKQLDVIKGGTRFIRIEDSVQ